MIIHAHVLFLPGSTFQPETLHETNRTTNREETKYLASLKNDGDVKMTTGHFKTWAEIEAVLIISSGASSYSECPTYKKD